MGRNARASALPWAASRAALTAPRLPGGSTAQRLRARPAPPRRAPPPLTPPQEGCTRPSLGPPPRECGRRGLAGPLSSSPRDVSKRSARDPRLALRHGEPCRPPAPADGRRLRSGPAGAVSGRAGGGCFPLLLAPSAWPLVLTPTKAPGGRHLALSSGGGTESQCGEAAIPAQQAGGLSSLRPCALQPRGLLLAPRSRGPADGTRARQAPRGEGQGR